MKLIKILAIMLIATAGHTQVTNGQLITAEVFNSKFNEVSNKLSTISVNVSFNTFTKNTEIELIKLNQNIDKIRQLSPSINIPDISNSLVRASEINLMFSNINTEIEKLTANSCSNLLIKRPNLLNLDGLYYLDSDGLSSPDAPFIAYCDMTTSGGGWTLLLSNQMAPQPTSGSQYQSTHPIYSGDSSISQNFLVAGKTMNTQDLQKAIKKVPGRYLKWSGGHVNKSTLVSTFSQKLAVKTPWDSSTNFLETEVPNLNRCITALGYTPAWNYNHNGLHTNVQILAGCHVVTGYSDRAAFGIAGRASQRGESCLSNCNLYFISSQPQHRGMTVITDSNDKNGMVWIK